ncbi:cadherin-like domain-containing protein [Vibrio alginolyticus]|uniref:cadherin-like domain-containing protein n=1 Tax=Vibrio alginolyticus TaxID=663 RepID=UPI003B66DA8C
MSCQTTPITPAENFHGDAEITYTVTDGALTDQATVNVTVNAVNDTPVVESNIADQTLAEDFTPYSIDLNTAFSDVDNVDGELSFRRFWQQQHSSGDRQWHCYVHSNCGLERL